jgi:predicted phosphodiesterase
MKLTFISDTHTMLNNPEYRADLTGRLDGGPIIVHSGDISSRGTAVEILNFLEWYSSLPYDNKVLVAGNHDFLI